MDDVVKNVAAPETELSGVASALEGGVVLVDRESSIVGMDARAQHCGPAALQALNAILRQGARPGLRCEAIAVEIGADGRTICVLRPCEYPESDADGMETAVANVMADGSWFTRAFLERLRALPRVLRSTAHASDLDALTRRERQILGLICEGCDDVEMSRILGLSRNTVRNHVASLYRTIGVNRRSAAVIWGRERGMTCLDAELPRDPAEKRRNGY
jgi:DNA-binding CsgD family transcriptional regulator